MHPTLEDLLGSARVVSLPLASPFRGIGLREALLTEGPNGWTEFSPFTEYEDAEASAWLAAAIDFGWNPTPAQVRDSVRVNATLPAVAPSEVGGVLARFPGCRTVKIKVAEVGQTLADDLARVAAVREYLGAEGRIRLDANGGWNVDEAEHAIHALAKFDLEYVEQPCATVEEL
ncbi:MAG: enolase C-terminal domain-like protein, partial [Rhodoglobus sp.]|nr:enolase C-terminal domain-like protein [Rhodoglobus sp.]